LRERRAEERRLAQALADVRRDEEYLRFQIDEVEALAPAPGEIEALEDEERRLRHAARIQETLREARGLLDGPLGEGAGELMRGLRRLARWGEPVPEAELDAVDAALAALAETLAERGREVEEAAGEGERLAARLGKLHALARKHGRPLAEILDWAAEQRERLDGLEAGQRRLDALRSASAAEAEALSGLAAALSAARREAAPRLAAAWQQRLALLGMAGCRLRVVVEPVEDPEGWLEVDGVRLRAGARGADRARILIRTNPDLPEGGLREVPSGGELSRIALARHLLGLAAAAPPLLVLDEVDAGLGADTAAILAGELSALSARRQLILVTHQAALAAAGSRQFRIVKDFDGDRTRVRVEALAGEARIEEIARMLGEAGGGAQARGLAERLLAEAGARAARGAG
jgi:DNA repair protein RecN (Recombination protein N)